MMIKSVDQAIKRDNNLYMRDYRSKNRDKIAQIERRFRLRRILRRVESGEMSIDDNVKQQILSEVEVSIE